MPLPLSQTYLPGVVEAFGLNVVSFLVYYLHLGM
jgi:hypothetical protein